jgi:N-acetylglucosamine-6-phosphate deacetylase
VLEEKFKILRGGKVLTGSGFCVANVIVKGGIIAEVTDSPVEIEGSEIIDATGMYVVPGGIDIHIHGGGGHEFIEGTEEAYRAAVQAHAYYGTTSVLPTLPACPVEKIQKGISICEKLMAEPDSPVLGLHLEGPYLNPSKIGAIIPEYVTPPIKEDYEMLLGSTSVIRRWDAAPELPGMAEFGRSLREHGVLASIAHTVAEYPEVKKAYDAGFTHATHFYNAMTSVHNVREYKHEGTVESIYAIPDMTVEVIADGKHVPPVILKLIWMIKGAERTALITDALGCSASTSTFIYDPRVVIHDGVCKLADHSALAGSIATMDRLVKTVTEAGVPFEDAVRMSSETPARILHVDDRKGSIAPGKDADIVFYDSDINLRFVMQRGHIVRDKREIETSHRHLDKLDDRKNQFFSQM